MSRRRPAALVVAHLERMPKRSFADLTIRPLLKQWSYKNTTVIHESLPRGGRLPSVYHKRTGELLYCVKGRAWATLDGKRFRLREGSLVWIPPGVRHTFSAITPKVEAISVFWPALNLQKEADVHVDEDK